MRKLYKINVKTPLGIVVAAFLLILTFCVKAAEGGKIFFTPFVSSHDTTPSKLQKDSLPGIQKKVFPADSSLKKKSGDSLIVVIDTLKISIEI